MCLMPAFIISVRCGKFWQLGEIDVDDALGSWRRETLSDSQQTTVGESGLGSLSKLRGLVCKESILRKVRECVCGIIAQRGLGGTVTGRTTVLRHLAERDGAAHALPQ